MLYDKLKSYSQSSVYPFHMPGHKRNFSDNLLPYSIDLTEIEGFDNLHNPQGCIKEIENLAKQIYKAEDAFLLINGTTGGILSAIRAMTKFGDKVAVARNCHKSVYNAIELFGLRPVYILPEKDEAFGVCSAITNEQIKNILKKHSDISLVVVTSPTYEGVVSDIKCISDTLHKNNILLLVDEAHGAHFPFSDKFSYEAVKCGADVAVVSLHKTLPSLTQTALLITSSNKYSDRIRETLSVFETSSPSYVLMSSIEKCLLYCRDNKASFEKYINLLDDFSKYSTKLKNLRVLCYGCDSKSKHKFYDFDISKICISTKNTNITGTQLTDILRNKYNIESEMSYSDYALLMTSICDSKQGFERLKTALTEIDKNICKVTNNKNISANSIPEQKFIPFERYKYKSVMSDFEKSENKISLEYVWAYPPGIPVIVPGEVITDKFIKNINVLINNGVKIHSTAEKMPDKISVVEQI